MIDRFPSFAGLKAFYAVAGSGGVVHAADQLGVTASAISHQLKKLEVELGVRLFDHDRGKLKLTADGAQYFQAVQQPMASIQQATNNIRSAPERRRVTLTLTPSFAASWLMPRLRDLAASHPDLELNLITTTRVVDMVRENIDLAIRRGEGGWPGVNSELLMNENIAPVLSPDLWEAIETDGLAEVLATTRALVNTTLLTEWDDWCAASGLEPPTSKLRFNLETYELSIQAARDGLGIALGRRPLVDDLLDNGELVSPFEDIGSSSVSYFLLWPESTALSSTAKQFARWVRHQNCVN